MEKSVGSVVITLLRFRQKSILLCIIRFYNSFKGVKNLSLIYFLGSTILEFLRLLTENVGQEVEPQLPLLYKKLILVIQRQFEYGKDAGWPLRYDKLNAILI